VTSINSLLSDHKHARRRTDRSAELIKESLQRYGAARSIVIDEDNRILAGNGTIEGAKAAGIKNVRIIETDGTEVIAIKRSGLSEDEKVGLALADNRTADLSEWDQAMLHTLSQEHDLSPWFNQEDLNELLAVTELPPEEGKTDPDDVPEPPADPITKPGDIWILGNHRLLCGDSTNIQHVERLMDGATAGLLLTDPPYGIGISSNPVRQKHQKKNWDEAPIDDNTLAYFNQLAPASIIWGGNYFGLPPAQCFYVWDKKQPEDFSLAMCELAWTNIPGPAKMFRLSVTSYKKDHPTQKPVELLEWCLAKADGLVLDPFGGSGSTLIACEKTSRQCRMMELDPTYCDVIVKRWEQFTGNTAVCHPSDAHFSQPDTEDF
jgi:16S rRNA G966 N2-methylase RsmD